MGFAHLWGPNDTSQIFKFALSCEDVRTIDVGGENLSATEQQDCSFVFLSFFFSVLIIPQIHPNWGLRIPKILMKIEIVVSLLKKTHDVTQATHRSIQQMS